MARRSTVPKVKKSSAGEDYSSFDLEALIRFHVYVRDNDYNPVPLSFRAFMKGAKGSHLKMLSTVDGIENRAKQLLVQRAILDEHNRKTGRYTASFNEANEEQLRGFKTRREAGAVTEYGRVWSDVGEYINDFIQLMIEGGSNPEYLRNFIKEQKHGLDPLRAALSHAKSKE